MTINIISDAPKSLKGINSQLTRLLRQDALEAEWPNNIVKNLKVSIDGVNIVINYPDKLATSIEDLEYGTPNESPKPIFRRFINRHGKFIAQNLREWSVDYLVDQGIIP